MGQAKKSPRGFSRTDRKDLQWFWSEAYGPAADMGFRSGFVDSIERKERVSDHGHQTTVGVRQRLVRAHVDRTPTPNQFRAAARYRQVLAALRMLAADDVRILRRL